MAKVTKLENICFDRIILEEYKIEDLSLLPKKYRLKALLQLPIVDVCKLENTHFTVDIAMDTIWEQLYQKYIGPTDDTKPKENWKHSLLNKLVATILNCRRPYGYFLKKTKVNQYVVSKICSDEYPTDHPVDIVNYLIAIKSDVLKKQNPDKELQPNVKYEALTCFQVTVAEGVVSPGKAYLESLKANNQIIPPRHMTFLNAERTFLPNLAALELIRKCGFPLKSTDISIPTFGAFLLHARQERPDFIEFLRKFLSTVESVTICDPQDETPRGVKLQERTEDSSPKLLQQGIETVVSAKLKSLLIVTRHFYSVIDCITPALTMIPSCLETFQYTSELNLPDYYFREIQSVLLKHRSTLRNIAIEQVQNGANLISWSVIFPWLQAALVCRSLQLLKVKVGSMYLQDFLNTLGLFLSTPCSQKQILSLDIIFEQFQSTTSRHISCADFLTEKLEKVDNRILQKKSIEFVDQVFFSSMFNPIRLGGLIATRIPAPSGTFRLLEQFETSEVLIISANLHSLTYADYKNFFKGSQLKSIIFRECENIVIPLLERAATIQGFTFEEIKKPDSAKPIYTATKVHLYETVQ